MVLSWRVGWHKSPHSNNRLRHGRACVCRYWLGAVGGQGVTTFGPQICSTRFHRIADTPLIPRRFVVEDIAPNVDVAIKRCEETRGAKENLADAPIGLWKGVKSLGCASAASKSLAPPRQARVDGEGRSCSMMISCRCLISRVSHRPAKVAASCHDDTISQRKMHGTNSLDQPLPAHHAPQPQPPYGVTSNTHPKGLPIDYAF